MQELRGVNPIFRKLLRKVRRRRGMSARQLAKRVDLHPSYISKIETGAAPPPLWNKIVAIAGVLESPELLEAGEYALLRHAWNLVANLLATLGEMPPKLAEEMGAKTLENWKVSCSEMYGYMLDAFDRRVRWQEVPLKKGKGSGH